jgi:hypothetical protein
MLLDYESEEESKSSMSPRCAAEIVGISDWDGVGRANKYTNGFLIVTHTSEYRGACIVCTWHHPLQDMKLCEFK